MSEGKEEGHFNGKWAVVTVHPSLPSKTEQVARARAWGVTESMLGRDDISALILDDVSKVKRTTNWMAKLEARAAFIDAMRLLRPEGDTVFFATPLCVGFSAKLAEQTVRGLWEAGMQVYVHSVRDNGAALYVDGDDLTEFLEMVQLAANAAYQRRFRARS
ncbi:hypothetical protein [Thioclava sp. NG1]|uniref:hypothetical protein n=1 Tax=Thioclava sp. NG1 TaxID=2182426 RepID=UPI0011B2466A|nr:hypothetical protein [Thioclava sp. NG1]